MPRIHRTMMVGLLALSLLAGGVIASEAGGEVQTLRDAEGRRVLIGTAIQAGQLDDPELSKLIGAQFNSLTAANAMKPDSLQRERGVFTFERADRIIEFA